MVNLESTPSYTNSRSYPTERPKSSPNWSLAEMNIYTHQILSSSDCCEKISRKMYTGNHSALLKIRTRRTVHNHALAGTADLGLSTWFPTGRFNIGTLPTLGSRLSISLWRTKDLSGLFLNLYPAGVV